MNPSRTRLTWMLRPTLDERTSKSQADAGCPRQAAWSFQSGQIARRRALATAARVDGPGARAALAVTFALAALLLAAVPAMAIVGGDPDGDRHPHVGMVYSPGFPNSCSGTLLSPTVVLTAGHCTHGFKRAGVPVYVSFAPEVDVDSTDEAIPATALHTHPDFCLGCAPGLPGFDAFDVGVVILAEPVTGLSFGQLPGAGTVDDLEKGARLTAVGYGVRYYERGGGPPTPSDRGLRHSANVTLIEVDSRTGEMFAKASGGSEKGGICFGDSGGPVFLPDQTTVVAVAAFLANRVCEGVGYYQRVDRADVLAWLEGFLPTSERAPQSLVAADHNQDQDDATAKQGKGKKGKHGKKGGKHRQR